VKNAIALAFAALALAGCSATSDTTATTATTASFDAPKVTAAGTSPISPSKQLVFCQYQVANMYDAEPQNVVTHERVVAADGSTTIDVTVDKGNEGVKTFKCRLDASNRFIDVMATTSDGV
jgi:PBP1b-binding outer membrane lipoprotein LpoB